MSVTAQLRVGIVDLRQHHNRQQSGRPRFVGFLTFHAPRPAEPPTLRTRPRPATEHGNTSDHPAAPPVQPTRQQSAGTPRGTPRNNGPSHPPTPAAAPNPAEMTQPKPPAPHNRDTGTQQQTGRCHTVPGPPAPPGRPATITVPAATALSRQCHKRVGHAPAPHPPPDAPRGSAAE
jgi:hypothetical protein